MGSQLQNGKQQFITILGTPLVGGMVYFYQPGTETPKATYQDQALSIANPNPVVLDARGQATIWGSGSYRQVVIDAFGVTIWDQIVADVTDGLISNLAGSGGSALIGFLQNGANAVATTLQAKAREMVTPQDFMTDAQRADVASRTGALDVSGAIRAAIAAAAGGSVFFPAGAYGLTSGITVTDGTALIGEGWNVSRFVPVGNFDVFTFTGGSQGAQLTHAWIDAGGMTGGNAVIVSNANRAQFTGLYITNPWNGFYVTTANVTNIRDIWLNGARGSYIIQWFGNAAQRSDVFDVSNFCGSAASYATNTTGLLIDGNVNTFDGRHLSFVKAGLGLWVKNSAGSTNNPQFISIYDFQSDYPLNEGIRLEGNVRTVAIASANVHQSQQADNIYIDVSAQNISLFNPQSDDAYLRGINAQGRYIGIFDPKVSNCSKVGSAQYPGIEIGAGSLGVTVSGGLSGTWVGYATNNQSYGVLVDAGAQAYSVVGVDLRNNVTGDYLDNARDGTSVIFANAQNSSTPNRITGPIMSQAGDLLLYAAGNFSAYLGNETYGKAFAAQPSGAASVNYAKAYGSITNISPALQAVGSDTNISLRLLPTGTGVLLAGGTISPLTDNSYSLGSASNRWAAVWAGNGSIQTSDATYKTDIAPSDLGLDFINALLPSKYRMKEGGVDVIGQQWLDHEGNVIPDGAKTYTAYFDLSGNQLPASTTVQKKQMTESYVDDNGNESTVTSEIFVDQGGNQIVIMQMDGYPGNPITQPRTGERPHYGFLSQDVKTLLDKLGIDFAGWILSDKSDPNSPQGLRYEEFIAPMVLAIQQLTARVVALEGDVGGAQSA